MQHSTLQCTPVHVHIAIDKTQILSHNFELAGLVSIGQDFMEHDLGPLHLSPVGFYNQDLGNWDENFPIGTLQPSN